MAESMYEKLKSFTTGELCEIDNTLNGWGWDDRLGEKPEGWDNLPRFDERDKVITKDTYVSPILRSIEVIVTKKALFRWHYINNLGKTNQEFEDWWDSDIEKQLSRVGRSHNAPNCLPTVALVVAILSLILAILS